MRLWLPERVLSTLLIASIAVVVVEEGCVLPWSIKASSAE